MRNLIRLSLLLAVLALALATGLFTGPARSASPCANARTGDTTVRLTSGGLTRSALVHVPRAGRTRPMALVVALHGAGGSGRDMAAYSGLSAFADRNHFIAVYPDAVAPPGKRPFWTLNGTDRTKPDDVRFVSDLLRRLQRTLCVDSRRVYATGVSNGGGMAARLGCELSARFAAIAPVAGGYRSLDPCRATRPVSVLEIHGTSDPVVPYDGRPPDYAGSVPRFLAGWTARNGCGTQPQSRFVAPGTQRTDWGGCREQTAVQHLRLSGVGHTWPGSSGSGSAVSASREVWLFFRGRMKSPAR